MFFLTLRENRLFAVISAALDQKTLGSYQAFGREDFFEALTARMEKRPPRFKGDKGLRWVGHEGDRPKKFFTLWPYPAIFIDFSNDLSKIKLLPW